MASTVSELIWLCFILQDLGIHLSRPLILYCDNLSALHMTVNLVFHACSKHNTLSSTITLFVKKWLLVLLKPGLSLLHTSLRTSWPSHYPRHLSRTYRSNWAFCMIHGPLWGGGGGWCAIQNISTVIHSSPAYCLALCTVGVEAICV